MECAEDRVATGRDCLLLRVFQGHIEVSRELCCDAYRLLWPVCPVLPVWGITVGKPMLEQVCHVLESWI